MCFAPQRRALFGHLNFQKWSDAGVFFHFDSCVSSHNSVQFFISHLASWLRTAALASLLFDPERHKSLEKHSVLRLSYLFAHLHFLSSQSFSSLTFSLLLFSSLTLPTSAFPSVHIVGSFTSKLPSTSMSNHIRWDNATTNILLAGEWSHLTLIFFRWPRNDQATCWENHRHRCSLRLLLQVWSRSKTPVVDGMSEKYDVPLEYSMYVWTYIYLSIYIYVYISCICMKYDV